MTVYVDNGRYHCGRMLMSHMVADTVEELHVMAERIGIDRRWFQNRSIPHYDICQAKRKLAAENGAKEITRTELAFLSRRLRAALRALREKEGRL